MIKKFEEFVNENYNSKENWTPEEIEQFGSFLTDICGYERSQWRRMQEFIIINGYTFEDTMNIFNRLGVAEHPTMDMLNYLKQLFDIDSHRPMYIKRKKDILDEINSKFNNGKKLPIAIDDYTGKILTGIVWYCEALDAYAENEDEFNDEGYEYLSNQSYEEGYTDDESIEYAEKNWENLGIYEIDLDKEC